MFIACYCWADVQRAPGCTHLMHKAILQNLLQGQVFAVCWQISENVLWTKPWSELLQGCVPRGSCSAAQPCPRDITSWLPGLWAVSSTTHPHTAPTPANTQQPQLHAWKRLPTADSPLWMHLHTWNHPCLNSSLSSIAQGVLPIQGQRGLQLKPGRLLPLSELF